MLYKQSPRVGSGHSVVVVFALGVGIVLHDEVFSLLLDARSARVRTPQRRCVCRSRFFRYRIAGIDPVCVDIDGRREIC